MSNKVYHANGTRADHQTPPALFWLLDQQNQFEFDAAATHESALCRFYLTEENSALTADSWLSPWWLNPPYGTKGTRGSVLSRPGQGLIGGGLGSNIGELSSFLDV